MDFIEWCGRVLHGIIEVTQASPTKRLMGVDEHTLAQHIFGVECRMAPGFWEGTQRHGMLDAVRELEANHLVEEQGQRHYLPTPLGKDLVKDFRPFWLEVCDTRLEREQEQLLLLTNRLSHHTAEDHAWLDEVKNDALLPELKWEDGTSLLWAVSKEVEKTGLLRRRAMGGGGVIYLAATYRGLAWETRRERFEEEEIAHVLFVDIVGYSRLPMSEQARSLRQLQERVRLTNDFKRAQSEDRLISLPTGDGMALVFFGGAIPHVRCATELARALKQSPELKVRMGIHTGPVSRLLDINTNLNVSGGGINVAQRVMDCGDAGHILLSKVVADTLQQIGGWEDKLRNLGEAEVKHGDKIHLFNLCDDEVGNAERPSKLIKVGEGSVADLNHVKSEPPIKDLSALRSIAGKYQLIEHVSDLTHVKPSHYPTALTVTSSSKRFGDPGWFRLASGEEAVFNFSADIHAFGFTYQQGISYGLFLVRLWDAETLPFVGEGFIPDINFFGFFSPKPIRSLHIRTEVMPPSTFILNSFYFYGTERHHRK